MTIPRSVSEFVEQELHERIKVIEDAYSAHAITFIGPIMGGVDDILRAAIEKRHGITPASKKLVFILSTEGGYIEVVQRIVATLRKHYSIVDFIIPNNAYSAGTVLALSGDAIHMDYYSRLGPIDPQVEGQSGKFVPALGYLEKYNGLLKKAQDGTISVAEIQLLIKGFDQAELNYYEHARDLSIALLKEWLVKYKFKDWKQTETRGLKVDKTMKEKRAEEIAAELNNTEKWHSHGHGISMDVLKKDLKVKIDDFGINTALSDSIRSYDELLTDYMAKLGKMGVVHYSGNYIPFMERRIHE
jgi:hypothetical protein